MFLKDVHPEWNFNPVNERAKSGDQGHYLSGNQEIREKSP